VSTLPSRAGGDRTTLGFVLVVIGLVFAVDNAGLLRPAGIGRWWPLLLIGVGIVKVRQPREDGQLAAGTAFLLLGCLFQAFSILTISSSWALLTIAAGVFLLWRGVAGATPEAWADSEVPYLWEMALVGYIKRRQSSPALRGGSVTAVMGGIELDLRKAALAEGTAYLDVLALWGGIDIKVPTGWAVDGRVIPFAGAFENKVDSPAVSTGPRLVVRGHAIMGAVVIGS
jgi:hypothetical protein